MSNQIDTTPLMKQYFQIKAAYPDMLVLFQVGDFYELFFDDAKAASTFLGIALTKRGKTNGEPIPLCGVPVHALNHYLIKLVRGGFKVALCDQLEEAQAGKVVDRGVTRVFTPGTLTESQLLDEKSSSYLFSFFPSHDQWGLIFGELLTAQLFVTVLPSNTEKMLEAELARFFPDEVLLPQSFAKSFQTYFKRSGYITTLVETSDEQIVYAQEWLKQQFKPEIISHMSSQHALCSAMHTFHSYLYKNQRAALDQFKSINFYQPDDFLIIDAATQRNLELIKNNQDGSRKNTLFSVIDQAATAMGSRMIKKWIMRPLISYDAITKRQDAIEYAFKSIAFLQQLEESLKKIGDVERVVGRIALQRGSLHDYLMLAQTLQIIPQIQRLLHQAPEGLYQNIKASLQDFSDLHTLLHSSLNDDHAMQWIIKKGFNSSLDSMRELIDQANVKIIDLEKQEQQKTGIGSLKIRYNQAHGYYIEVTKTHSDSIPEYYKRQQTLVGRERYIIPELQQLQNEIMTATRTIDQKEKEIFASVKATVSQQSASLRKMAYALSSLDALMGLSKVAYENNYSRPALNKEHVIAIEQGRHPVVEQQLQHKFISNSTQLTDEESLLIITGPNMGGKSTYLRQVALICILAHIGSFVPAKSADIALLDRIFSRIGAGDNLAEGKSTFLVEMEETAAICLYATQNSLVILDEVGRGTSTFDGLAIAQAVVEYMYTTIRARCLFATHYHELASLKDRFPGIASYYASSKKLDTGILFLYVMSKGIAHGSFGIEVAKLAQLPQAIIERSQEILEELEQGNTNNRTRKSDFKAINNNEQHEQLFSKYQQIINDYQKLQKQYIKCEEMLKHLTQVDYEALSPKAAFDLLWHFKHNSGK